MSEFGHCVRGGMEGIVTNTGELNGLADFMKSKYMDEYIPLPGITHEKQKESIILCVPSGHESLKDVSYWETETGKHGWCCSKCGTVIQWG